MNGMRYERVGPGEVRIPPNVNDNRRGWEPSCAQRISGEIEGLWWSMRNLLDESSDAQSLDGHRLTGSLHFPEEILIRVGRKRKWNDRRLPPRFVPVMSASLWLNLKLPLN